MAMILITDNPQGGACRCEGQAQALDLSNLRPEQVEALKQALGVSKEQAVFDPEKLSEENVVALREKIFDIASSDRKFFDRNRTALQNLFIEPSSSGEYDSIASGFVELGIGEDPQGTSRLFYDNTYIELRNQQEVESVARKLDVGFSIGNGMFSLESVVRFLLASAVSSDRQIDALKAELAELKAQR